jgi:superfamily I DNA/RNA helicase
MLLAEPRIAAAVDEDSITTLQAVRELFRTQVLVDEATDFSPIQLACMGALSDPATNAFLACGDFNQRITSWGARSEAELKWVFPDIDIRTIRITYRHSRQLNALAHRIAQLSDDGHQAAALPEHVDNEGFDPVLALGVSGDDLVSWLRDRILEIERLTGSLPSIAVLVNQELEVQPLADALQQALADHNIQCSACPNGQVRGNDNDVRVFDVQHIKGLEFEAVFFVGVDELAENRPDLFDKFLYVGATRAAMYFGLTSGSESLPAKLAPLRDAFASNWPA